MEKPHRACELSIAIGSDSEKDIIDSLNQIVFELESKGVRGGMTSGSPSSGWFVEFKTYPEMTHEKYHQELSKWLAQIK